MLIRFEAWLRRRIAWHQARKLEAEWDIEHALAQPGDRFDHPKVDKGPYTAICSCCLRDRLQQALS